MPDFDLKPGLIVTGLILPEPVKVITTNLMGQSIKLIGDPWREPCQPG